MPYAVQAFEITYTDRPLDLVYDERIAEKKGQADDVTGVMPLVIVRYENGEREYLPNMRLVGGETEVELEDFDDLPVDDEETQETYSLRVHRNAA